MSAKKVKVKRHKRSNPKSDGKHTVQSHTREVGGSGKGRNDNEAVKDGIVGSLKGDVPTSEDEAIIMDIGDATIGLIPVIGDVPSLIRGGRLVASPDLSVSTKLEGLAWMGGDFVVGLIPGYGDAVDAVFVSNVAFYRRHKEELDKAFKDKKVVKKDD